MINYLVLIGCLILAIACEEYVPQGSNEVFVEQKENFDLPELEINCFDDTINLFNSSTVKYNIIAHGNPIEEVQINSESHNYAESFDYGSGEFTLNSEYLTEGNHKLDVHIIFDSNTGSLANKLGAEMYYVDYLVNMNYTKPYKASDRHDSNSMSAILVGNTVKISWRKYNLNDFNYYNLFCGDPDESRGRHLEWTRGFNNYNDTEYSANLPETDYGRNYILKIFKKDGSYIRDECTVFLDK